MHNQPPNPPQLTQEERNKHYEALKRNPLFVELLSYIQDNYNVYKNRARTVDLMNYGNGAILVREKAFGMETAFEEISSYIQSELPKSDRPEPKEDQYETEP